MVRAEVFKQLADFESEWTNKHLNANAARQQVNELPEEALHDAIEAERDCCRRAKRWCSEKVEGFRQQLNDPTQNLSPADRERRKQFCNEAARLLQKLEQECPPDEADARAPKDERRACRFVVRCEADQNSGLTATTFWAVSSKIATVSTIMIQF